MKNLLQKKWMLSFVGCSFIFLSTTSAANYVVSGAGQTELNGTYVETGMWNEKPLYILDNHYAIGFEMGSWKIGEWMGNMIMGQYTIDSTNDTPPSMGWGGFPNPVPTVEVVGKSLAYSLKTFRENDLNDGSIFNTITINLTLETFTGSNDEDFVSTGKVIVSNMPEGLTASMIRKSDESIEFLLNGHATNHTNTNDVTDLTITFQDNAFSSNNASQVVNNNVGDVRINFIQNHTVASTGGDYTTIQAAIDAAEDFDIILLANEIFTEKITINKSLKIKGQGAKISIIQAATTPSTANGRVITCEAETLKLEDLTIRNGNESSGGGVWAKALYVSRCEIVNNKIEGDWISGGGIYSTFLDIRDSYIARNYAYSTISTGKSYGGAIYTTETLLMTNCTVTDNTASGLSSLNSGGGIMALYCTIINSTITGNSATNGGGLYINAEGIIKNSILWGNTATSTIGKDLMLNDIVSAYNSIIGNAAHAFNHTPIINVSEHVTNVNPLLNQAANNGGPTVTISIQSGSPAINAGITGSDIPNTDQRGEPATGIRDIGAYEFNSSDPTPEIGVKQTTNAIVDGTGNVDFGSSAVNTDKDILFTIENTGAIPSFLGNFTITGADANQFSFQGASPTTVATSGTTTFTVRFSPTSYGAKTATVTFDNQDADENPYSFTITGNGANPMQLVFTTTDAGQSIELPFIGTVNCTVNWGDGSAAENVTLSGFASHTYTNAGTYTVSITGAISKFGNGDDSWHGAKYLTEVKSFGDVGLTALRGAFEGAENLSSVPALLPSTITSLYNCFSGIPQESITNLNLWDVSNVTNMQYMFSETTAFNQDISNWNVAHVTNMNSMFMLAAAFNQNISGWDVSLVTNMDMMFGAASSFNQAIGNWDVSQVESMIGMFYAATAFDQNIGSWDIGKVTNMTAMFEEVCLSTANYDALLKGWAAQIVQSEVTFSGGTSKYSAGAAATARDVLTSAPNRWTITDGGINTPTDIAVIQPMLPLQITPNLVTHEFSINNLVDEANITIMDMNGKICHRAHVSPASVISVDQLPAGIYLLTVKTGEKITPLKLVKK